jgi:putative ABC transport system permease protein
VTFVEGDLIELYRERRRAGKKWKADVRFILDVILLFRPGIVRPLFYSNPLLESLMLENYLKVGFRNLVKYKAFSFINIFGLSLAMSVCLLLILMLADQSRYDRFHEKKARIYRILSDTEHGRNAYATSPFPLAAALKSEYTIAEDATVLTPGAGGDAFYLDRAAEMRGYFADPSFFNLFSFELEAGNKTTALREPNTIVISRTVAEKLFRAENPIGKSITFSDRQLPFPQRHDDNGAAPVDWGSFTITGVFDPKKYSSHLEFDMLVSSATRPLLYAEKKLDDLSNNWEWYYRSYTYVLLPDGKTIEDLNKTLAELVAVKYKNITAPELKGFNFKAQPLTEIQLGLQANDTNSRMPMIGYYFLGFLAVVIMVSACLNYTNLSVARALTRAKEIGIRKVTGAFKRSLIFQFLTESVLTSFIALAFAFLFLNLLKPLFKGLWVNRFLNFQLDIDFKVIGIFVAFALVIGLIGGLFPAFYLSKFQPVKVLKKLGDIRPGRFRIQKVLSVVQFVISLLFITTSILIYNQFHHYMKFDYGFQAKNILNVELQGVSAEKLANEFSSVAGVSAISASDIVPALNVNNGMDLKKPGAADEFVYSGIIHADPNFTVNLGVPLVAGKHLTNDPSSIVVNEDMVLKMGFKNPSEIVGTVVETKWGNEQLTIVGVVKNFKYISLINSHGMVPLILRNRPESFKYLQIYLPAKDKTTTLTQIEEKWKRIDPAHPIKYEFYEDQLSSMHQGIFDLVSVVGFITFMAIVIACLGLLGMATYSVERKRREVGIRKVMGAPDISIALLLSREFLAMLVVSIIIAAPLSYLVNNLWLQMLPNRVNFGAGMVTTGSLILLILGVLTIVSQTWKASRSNPVEALKVE